MAKRRGKRKAAASADGGMGGAMPMMRSHMGATSMGGFAPVKTGPLAAPAPRSSAKGYRGRLRGK